MVDPSEKLSKVSLLGKKNRGGRRQGHPSTMHRLQPLAFVSLAKNERYAMILLGNVPTMACFRCSPWNMTLLEDYLEKRLIAYHSLQVKGTVNRNQPSTHLSSASCYHSLILRWSSSVGQRITTNASLVAAVLRLPTDDGVTGNPLRQIQNGCVCSPVETSYDTFQKVV